MPASRLRIAAALRDSLADGYGAADLQSDLVAGIIVGIVALPLSMALAIASGVPPQHGLYTAIVGGGIIALLGGSRTQVSGPTAAFVVLLAPVAARFGLGGLLLATVMAGAIQLGLGLGRLGRLIQFVPYPVTTGFTSGIAIVIATLQIKDLLGLDIPVMPDHYLQRVTAMGRALPSTHWPDLAIGVLTLVVLLSWPRLVQRLASRRLARLLPAPLVALTLGAVAAALLSRWVPEAAAATIASRFHYAVDGVVFSGVPRLPPVPALPWRLPGGDGAPLGLSLSLLRELIGPALAIAILGAIESLLSAVVADGMTGHQHDPDAELVAQGVGNLVVPFFGGISATGAIARTATSVRSGARSPIASICHALFVLSAVVLLAPALGYLPMASLAALLLLVAWNMSEARHVLRTVRVAPRSDVLILLTCLGLTVVFDMVVSVLVGVVLASLLFMRRMAEVAGVRLVGSQAGNAPAKLPADVLVYEIAGPLFFGAAQKAMSSLQAISSRVRTVVFDLRAVPAMDQTGLVNLESAIARLHRANKMVILAGVQSQPREVLARAGVTSSADRLEVCPSFADAIEMAATRSADLAAATQAAATQVSAPPG